MQIMDKRAILFLDMRKEFCSMKDFIIFTDGDVDVPKPYDADVIILPQYYYFESNTIYGDEQVLPREMFFDRLSSQRAYTAGVNPDLVYRRFEEILKTGSDILCITVSSGISGSHNTICAAARELKTRYPHSFVKVIDSLSATLGAGFLCVDAVEMKRQGKSLDETAAEIEKRVKLLDIFFIVDDFKYLIQGGRVSPAIGKIGDILDIKPILTIRDGHIELYKKARGLNTALRNIQTIAESRKAARLGNIYVGNQEMFEKCCSHVPGDYDVRLNLIVSSHVGPNTTGVAIEWEV